MKTKVNIVDDHKIVTEGIASFINQTNDFIVNKIYHDGADLRSNLYSHKSEILLLDLDLPHVSGIEILEELKNFQDNSILVLILTMHNDFELVKKCKDLGAAGYMLKNASNEELIQALRHIKEFNPFYTDPNLKTLPEEENKNSFTKLALLSSREKEIISLIVQEKTSIEISEILCLSEETIKTYRKNIFSKLNINKVIGLTKFALENDLA